MREFETDPAPDHKRYVRKVTLPSGKTIEVVSFEEPAAAPAETQLHVCPDCASQLVYPVAWEEAGHTRWTVSLRCPNCEWHCTDVFDDEVVLRFDEALDRGTDSLVGDLRRLAHSNMLEDVERFVRALNDGHVLPEDF